MRDAITDNPDLSKSWDKLDNFGDDVIRKDPDALKKIKDFDDGTGGKFDELGDEFKKLPDDQKKGWVNHLDKRTVDGKVRKAGDNAGKYDSFNSSGDVPTKYSSNSRFESLSKDPAHAGGPKELTSRTRQEAMAGLEAESQGLIKAPIKREPNGDFEFVDGDGKYWDVKTPPGGKYFNAAESGGSVKTQLDNAPNVKVVIDTTYINDMELQSLRSWLNNNLAPNDLSRIVEVNSNLL